MPLFIYCRTTGGQYGLRQGLGKIKTSVQELIKSFSMRVSRTPYVSDRRVPLWIFGFGLYGLCTKIQLFIRRLK